MKSSAKNPVPTTALPAGIVAADKTFPKMDERINPDRDNVPADVAYSGLTFYRTTGFGWVLCTLGISKATGRRASSADRTYGIVVATEGVCRVGFGPHVTEEVTVYVTKSNIERLRKYVDLWTKGMAAAGSVRDRISSRRAEGQVKRAAGLHSWRWDS